MALTKASANRLSQTNWPWINCGCPVRRQPENYDIPPGPDRNTAVFDQGKALPAGGSIFAFPLKRATETDSRAMRKDPPRWEAVRENADDNGPAGGNRNNHAR